MLQKISKGLFVVSFAFPSLCVKLLLFYVSIYVELFESTKQLLQYFLMSALLYFYTLSWDLQSSFSKSTKLNHHVRTLACPGSL